jgi:ankyrin repeat protein
MYAALDGNVECCKFLVEAGATVDWMSENRTTVLDMAVMDGK